jgi:LCP family protein required for cell wall assembly
MQGSSHPRRPATRGGRPGRIYGGRSRGLADRDSRLEPRAGDALRARLADRQRDGAGDAPPDRDQGRTGSAPRLRARTPLWATAALTAGAVLMLLSGTALAGYEVLNNRYAGNVRQENLLGDAGAAADPGKELSGPLNLLLLGVEERGEGARSDTIIVLHIPASHDQAYLISVPRDTWVSVPGYWDMKITDTFNTGYQNGGGWVGGGQLVANVLHDVTGLSFDAAAIVNFDGFQRIIDELGGLRFCVDTAATSEHLVLVDGEPMGVGRARREGHWDAQPIRYEVGCQQLEGWQALDYARQRKTLENGAGDYGRQQHQRQLLTSMADAVVSRDVLTNLGKLDSLILAAGDALIVDTNTVPMADFVFTLRDIRPSDLVSLRTNGGEYHSARIPGVSAEALSPESLEMFRAAATDTMAEFVLNHPHFVGE